jgi:hypothetical protein
VSTLPPADETEQMRREMDLRGCASALWLALLQAERAGWPECVAQLMELYAEAAGRERESRA